MPMTLRLSDAAEANLDRVMRGRHIASKTVAIETAIAEMADRTSQVGRARAHVARIVERDGDLLDRLSR